MSMPPPLPPVDGYAADIYSSADPSAWDWRLALTRFIGLDIGMRSDHSAYVLLGAWRTAAGITMAPIDSRQFPLQTPYDDVAIDTAAAHQQYDAKLIVDCSNAAPFLGLLAPRMRDPKNNLVAAAITSARDHNLQPAKHLVGLGASQIAIPLFALGKMPLLQAINFGVSDGSLRPAHAGHWELLMAEMEAVQLNEHKSKSYGASAAPGQHDDMVMAMALSVWACGYFGGLLTRARRPVGRKPPPSPIAWT
jgi:hypothetical protein